MNKQEAREMERLKRLLEAERERSEKAWNAYKETLYELVDLRMQLDEIKAVFNQEGDQSERTQ